MSTVLVRHDRLNAWALAMLGACGVPGRDALITAEMLVQTCLWGIDSHGILRLTTYLDRLKRGSIKANPNVSLVDTGPCTAQLMGDDGLGFPHADRAMRHAVKMAKKNGVGIVGVSHSNHCGAIGLYTRIAASEGLVGIGFTQASAIVVPHTEDAAAKKAYFGTNPISIAFPREASPPLVLDMATSQVAWNKVMNARTEGAALPEGISVDAGGHPTTDAKSAAALIPLGGETYGYKGYGLAMMVDLLCGALNGMAWGPNVSPMYDEMDRPRRLGHLMIAIDPRRFAGGFEIAEATAALTDDLKSRGAVLCPGDPEYLAEAERRQNGIPFEPGGMADMREWSERLGVAFTL